MSCLLGVGVCFEPIRELQPMHGNSAAFISRSCWCQVVCRVWKFGNGGPVLYQQCHSQRLHSTEATSAAQHRPWRERALVVSRSSSFIHRHVHFASADHAEKGSKGPQSDSPTSDSYAPAYNASFYTLRYYLFIGWGVAGVQWVFDLSAACTMLCPDVHGLLQTPWSASACAVRTHTACTACVHQW